MIAWILTTSKGVTAHQHYLLYLNSGGFRICEKNAIPMNQNTAHRTRTFFSVCFGFVGQQWIYLLFQAGIFHSTFHSIQQFQQSWTPVSSFFHLVYVIQSFWFYWRQYCWYHFHFTNWDHLVKKRCWKGIARHCYFPMWNSYRSFSLYIEREKWYRKKYWYNDKTDWSKHTSTVDV